MITRKKDDSIKLALDLKLQNDQMLKKKYNLSRYQTLMNSISVVNQVVALDRFETLTSSTLPAKPQPIKCHKTRINPD